MKTFVRSLVLGCAVLSVVGNAGAADTRDVASLEDSRNQLAWEANNARGVDKLQLKEEEQRLQDMIDTLNGGGRVDPSEVDRALNRTR